MLLSHRHPLLYKFAVFCHRMRRRLLWFMDRREFASEINLDPEARLTFNVKRHSSRLLKKLGDTEMWLQHNKVENLKLCLPYMNGLLIRPGETFSFCNLIGQPTAKRGFKVGMELTMGKARPGVGGGICQLANMLHWLVIHSPLTVTERSTHSFDPFPDQKRSIPFGTGCAIFYNYVDFCFVNETDYTFQLFLTIDDNDLKGHLVSDEMIAHNYKVFEQNHYFVREGDTVYRHNEIWRKVLTRVVGKHLYDEHIKTNHVRVLYEPDEDLIREGD